MTVWHAIRPTAFTRWQHKPLLLTDCITGCEFPSQFLVAPPTPYDKNKNYLNCVFIRYLKVEVLHNTVGLSFQKSVRTRHVVLCLDSLWHEEVWFANGTSLILYVKWLIICSVKLTFWNFWYTMIVSEKTDLYWSIVTMQVTHLQHFSSCVLRTPSPSKEEASCFAVMTLATRKIFLMIFSRQRTTVMLMSM